MPFAKKRLPYHKVAHDTLSAIGSELSKASIKHFMLIARVTNINPDDIYVLAVKKTMEKLFSRDQIGSNERDRLPSVQLMSKRTVEFSDISYFVSQIKDYKTAIDVLTEVSQYDDDYIFKIEACKIALQKSTELFQVRHL